MFSTGCAFSSVTFPCASKVAYGQPYSAIGTTGTPYSTQLTQLKPKSPKIRPINAFTRVRIFAFITICFKNSLQRYCFFAKYANLLWILSFFEILVIDDSSFVSAIRLKLPFDGVFGNFMDGNGRESSFEIVRLVIQPGNS